MKIKIVPYNDEWPLLFETIKKEIKKIITDNEIIIEDDGEGYPNQFLILKAEDNPSQTGMARYDQKQK